MTRRCVVVLLAPVRWVPPGVPAAAWQRALAEDVVDLLVPLAEVDVALAATAADRPVAEAIRWPTTPVYELATSRPLGALRAATAAGYEQAAVLPADLPDLPALLIGKLFRALSDRSVAAAPRLPHRTGLAALASRLPVPDWFADADPSLDDTDPARLRAAARAVPGAAPHGGVAAAPGWHRLCDPDDLARLDESLEGWEQTRALLTA